MDLSKPVFLHGAFNFIGKGLEAPVKADGATYQVPFDRRAQLIYFRAGNSADSLINIVLYRNGRPMRYFPLGAKSAMHVPMAVVEDLTPESKLEFKIAAPEGVAGTAVVDIGFVEI